ncbi:MAG: DNA repair protein RecO [Sphingomonadales bacterium]
MEWTAEGTLCTASKHGENGIIAKIFTADHGLVAGYVPGGMGRRMRPILEPGNDVKARWRARLADHLGTYQVELITPRAAQLMPKPLHLAAMTSLLTTLAQCLPEREAYPALKAGLDAILTVISAPSSDAAILGAAVIRFEVELLSALGFALDLAHCAATGQTEELIYVSPKTGRAVSQEAGEPYRDKLLALPQFLLGSQAGPVDAAALSQGFQLTGYFIDRWVLEPQSRDVPAARRRFEHLLEKAPP